MILAPTTMIRLVLLGLFAALAQITLFGQMTILGTSPDFATLVVMSLGLLGGSLAGAIAGFSIGLMIDTLMLQTLGATALTLLTVGYFAGRYRESIGQPTRGGVALIGGALTLLAALFFALIQVMLGINAAVSPLVARDIIVVSLLGMVLAVPVQAAVRRLLRSALIEDRPQRSRPVTPTPVSTIETPHDVSV